MRRLIAAFAVATMTLGWVSTGVASAAPVAATPVASTAVVQTTTVLGQFPDPSGSWIVSVVGTLAGMYPDGNLGGGVKIFFFGGSSSPSGAQYLGYTIVYPGYTITIRWDSDVKGGSITVYLIM